MADKSLSSDQRHNENDCMQDSKDSGTIPSLQANAYESFQPEFKTMNDGAKFRYSSESTTQKCSPVVEDIYIMTQLEPLLQIQHYFHNEQTNWLFKCSYSGGESTELEQKKMQEKETSVNISDVGRCIRTACDVLYEINSENNDLHSEICESNTFPSDLNAFHSQSETVVLKNDLLNKEGSTSKNKCEKAKLNNEPSKSVSNSENFNSTHINSDTFLRQNNFQRQIETSSFQRTFIRDICLKKLNTSSSLLNHKCIHPSEKPSQDVMSQKDVSQKGYVLKRNHANITEKSTQCKTFLENDRVRHMRRHTRKKSLQCDICKSKFSYTSSLTRHMFIHTGKKPFQCNICKLEFARKDHLDEHMWSHTVEKSFLCEVCDKRYTQKKELSKHKRLKHAGYKGL